MNFFAENQNPKETSKILLKYARKSIISTKKEIKEKKIENQNLPINARIPDPAVILSYSTNIE